MKDVFTHGTVHPRDAIPAVAASGNPASETYVYFHRSFRMFPRQSPYLHLLIYVLYRRLDEADDGRVLLTVSLPPKPPAACEAVKPSEFVR